MKRFLTVAGLIAVCLLAGYGIGLAIGSIMKTSQKVKNQKSLYVGKPVLEIKDGVMTPEVLHSLGYVSDPQVSADGKKILFGISYSSIEKNRTCRNIYLLDTEKGTDPICLTKSGESISCARWGKDSKSIWFVRDGQIRKASFNGRKLGRIRTVSDVPGGVGEFAFNSDFSSILYTTSIPGPVKSPSQLYGDLPDAKAYVADDLMYRHWDHWVTETPRTCLAPAAGKITAENSRDLLGDEPFELPTEPFGGLEQTSFSPDGRYIAYSCRKLTGVRYAFSTNTDIFIYDTVSGETSQVTFGGGYDTCPLFSPDGERLAWISMERDGYEADRERLMVVPVKDGRALGGLKDGRTVGQAVELSRSLDADCSSPVWSADGKSIFFNATEKTLCGIYRTDLQGNVSRITKDTWWYDFGPVASLQQKDGGYEIISSYQSLEFPTELVRLSVGAGGECSFDRITSINSDAFSEIDPIKVGCIELPTVNAEKLFCWVLYPPQFDPSGKWGAIEMLEGGPQSCLGQSWSKRWNFRLMAQQGYVVILPCRHGCSGLGQAWKEQISGDYQGLNMQDYLAAGKWIKSQSWCSSLAAVGASYGGFSVYNIAGIHEGLFDCFISHAGIFDLNSMWYTTEESWFTNWDNGGLGKGPEFGSIRQGGAPYSALPATVRHFAGSPDKKILKWDTPILCIHGMLDFRIPYEQGMAAFNAAKMMGVPAKLVVFPEECHWVTKPQNCIFWQREFFQWLEQWMK